MPNKVWTPEELRDEYRQLWDTAVLREAYRGVVEREAQRIAEGRGAYNKIEAKIGVPWYFTGIVHSLECGLKWTTHLHNGDSLKRRTWQVPAHRPAVGDPPFTWEESALDALTLKGLHELKDWSVERTLYEFERYNGFGYRNWHPDTKSPYLWSFTNHYRRGKYVADGKWSATAVSQQTGAAALLKALAKNDPTIKL